MSLYGRDNTMQIKNLWKLFLKELTREINKDDFDLFVVEVYMNFVDKITVENKNVADFIASIRNNNGNWLLKNGSIEIVTRAEEFTLSLKISKESSFQCKFDSFIFNVENRTEIYFTYKNRNLNIFIEGECVETNKLNRIRDIKIISDGLLILTEFIFYEIGTYINPNVTGKEKYQKFIKPLQKQLQFYQGRGIILRETEMDLTVNKVNLEMKNVMKSLK